MVSAKELSEESTAAALFFSNSLINEPETLSYNLALMNQNHRLWIIEVGIQKATTPTPNIWNIDPSLVLQTMLLLALALGSATASDCGGCECGKNCFGYPSYACVTFSSSCADTNAASAGVSFDSSQCGSCSDNFCGAPSYSCVTFDSNCEDNNAAANTGSSGGGSSGVHTGGGSSDGGSSCPWNDWCLLTCRFDQLHVRHECRGADDQKHDPSTPGPAENASRTQFM